MRYLLILLVTSIIFGCSEPIKEEPKYIQEKIKFASKNILGFENIFSPGLELQEDIEVFGVLHFPDDYDETKKYFDKVQRQQKIYMKWVERYEKAYLDAIAEQTRP